MNKQEKRAARRTIKSMYLYLDSKEKKALRKARQLSSYDRHKGTIRVGIKQWAAGVDIKRKKELYKAGILKK